MDDYLSKPFTEPELYRILRSWLPSTGTPAGEQVAASVAAGEPEEVLDISSLAGFRARAGLLERLVSAYLNQSANQMQQLRDAVAADDLAAVRDAAHTLKSSSAQLGATSLPDHYQALESSARAGDAEALSGPMAAAEDVYPRFCAALSAQSTRAAA